MRASEGLRDRLFRHDSRIVINAARANLARWRDRLNAAAIVLLALAVARSWVGHQSCEIATWAALGAGVIAGIGAGRLVGARIGFHGFDGLLAADALRASLRRPYLVAWYGIGMAVLTAITLIVRPSLLIASAPAYLAGIFAAHMTSRVATSGWATGTAAVRWQIRRWLHHPGAGVVAAMILLLSLLAAHELGTEGIMAVAGVEAVFFALVLTSVEHRIVRFMSISGHSPWRIVIRYSRGTLLFAGQAVPVCCFALGPVTAGIILAASGAVLLLLAMRVFAYCAHDKRFADLLVSIFAGLLMLVAYSMPVLLPFLAIAMLWQLHRGAAAQTWVLA